MTSIYDIKPLFQKLLRPLSDALYFRKVTPNQVTVSTCCLSIFVGFIVIVLRHHPAIFWLMPIFFFIRMALNAIDGMLAKEHNMKSKLGAFLNELTDMISDSALYLPFAFMGNSFNFILVLLIILFSILTEATGLAALSVGASRRYDGPMGKSDRAFVFSAIAFLFAIRLLPGIWLNFVWIIVLALLIYTIINRINRAIAETR